MNNQFTAYFDKNKLYQDDFLRTLNRLNIESLINHENAFNKFLKNKFTRPNELEVTLFSNKVISIASELKESNNRLDQLYELHGLKNICSGSVKQYKIYAHYIPEWKRNMLKEDNEKRGFVND